MRSHAAPRTGKAAADKQVSDPDMQCQECIFRLARDSHAFK